MDASICFHSVMAEGVRFELTRELAPPAGFQDRCLKPLGHPSSLRCQILSKRRSVKLVPVATGLLPFFLQFVPATFSCELLCCLQRRIELRGCVSLHVRH